MDINKKNRTDLKAFFVKNAIPTENNFADLIDAGINQKEDGIAKLAGNPLSIQAEGGASGTQKLINFYTSFTDNNPSWMINQNPRETANNAATAKPGFNIATGDGTTRLFISNTGQIGIGTITPVSALDVKGSISVNGQLRVDSAGWFNSTSNTGWRNLNFGGGWFMQDAIWIRSFGSKDVYVNKKLRADEGFEVGSNGGKFKVLSNGNVGIQTPSPVSALDVKGSISVSSLVRIDTAGWFFSQGNGGWRNAKHGGGWFMSDGTWIRSFGSKDVYVNKKLRADQGFEVGTNGGKFKVNSAGSLGIGTANPAANLHIRAAAGQSSKLIIEADPTNNNENAHPELILYQDGKRAMGWIRFATSGNRNNDLYIQNRTLSGTTWQNSGYIILKHGNTIQVSKLPLTASDISLKKNIKPLDYGLKEIMNLRPVSYNFKGEANPTRSIGLIAQDVQKVINEVVEEGADDGKGSKLHLGYSNLIPVLINAVKELNQKIEKLSGKAE